MIVLVDVKRDKSTNYRYTVLGKINQIVLRKLASSPKPEYRTILVTVSLDTKQELILSNSDLEPKMLHQSFKLLQIVSSGIKLR